MTPSLPSTFRPLGTIVLGMSRSGTSAVAGMFTAAGFHAGAPADLVGAHESNPRGHYENLRVVRMHDEALAELDASWFDAPDADGVATLQQRFAPRVAAVVDRLAAEAAGRPLVIKDPRAGLLTGLWADQLHGRLIPLLVLRDPREIALSLSRRDGTPPALGLAGWERHLRLLLCGLHGREAVVVRYAELVADPGHAARVVADVAHGLPEPLAAAVDSAAAPAAIDVRLHHAGPIQSRWRR